MPTYYGTNTSGMNNAANNVLDIQQAHQYNQRYQDEKRARSRAMAIQSLQGLGDKLYQYGRDQKADTVSKEIRDANKLYQDEQLKMEKARDARETAKSIYDRYDSWKKDKTAQANAEREMKRLEDALSATKEHYRAIEQGTTNRNNLDAAKFNEELRAAKYKPVMELISGVGDAFKDGLAASRAAKQAAAAAAEAKANMVLEYVLKSGGTKTTTNPDGTRIEERGLTPEVLNAARAAAPGLGHVFDAMNPAAMQSAGQPISHSSPNKEPMEVQMARRAVAEANNMVENGVQLTPEQQEGIARAQQLIQSADAPMMNAVQRMQQEDRANSPSRVTLAKQLPFMASVLKAERNTGAQLLNKLLGGYPESAGWYNPKDYPYPWSK